jgi:hypothetical protein
LLIKEGKKDDGRKRKFAMIKSQQKAKVDRIEQVMKLTKVSSAALAANIHLVLDEIILEHEIRSHAACCSRSLFLERDYRAS